MDLKELTATIDKAVSDLAQARAETIVAQKENDQLKAEVASLKQSVVTITAAKAELETKLTEATASAEQVKAELATVKADAEKAVAEVSTSAEKSVSEIEALTQRAEAAEAQVQVFEQADLMTKRVAALDEAGVLVDETEDAKKSVAMNQEEFDAFVAERIKFREAIAGKTPPTKKEEDMTDEERLQMMKKKKKAEEEEAAEASKAEADVTVFPVFEGISVANRTLAALMANDPKAQDTFSKYANL